MGRWVGAWQGGWEESLGGAAVSRLPPVDCHEGLCSFCGHGRCCRPSLCVRQQVAGPEVVRGDLSARA